ncbi:hypothetical protein [Cupriavidus pampae]|uniref:Transmembrane protein n=1 Tax=Cupriavidus pampae TaxID=659251 RepID=A0ABM8WAG2_9BURK|nr:hypothetical protein [Cupriavidus pampae]CAG9164259.1 hypothetical protein LMG32289_00600 [Cupriavidus pampae]
MKVKQYRHGQTLRRACELGSRPQRARVASAQVMSIAGLVMVVALLPHTARAQSAGMANLLHHPPAPASSASESRVHTNPAHERADQREARARAEKYRTERDMAERASRQGPGGGNPKLSPDERKTLRKNLLDLSKEMYSGGG